MVDKSCNTNSTKATDPFYECNPRTGRWIKKKKTTKNDRAVVVAKGGAKECNAGNGKASDPAYECNTRTGRWVKKKPETKIRQVKDTKKTTILILQAGYDPNRAFDNRDAGLLAVLGQFPNFDVRHHIIHSVRDMMVFTEQYPRISHLILMAHGSRDGSSIILSKACRLRYGDPDFVKWAGALKERLSPRAPILLHSCSLGSGKVNVAKTLSVLLPGHVVYASTDTISRGDLLVSSFILDNDRQLVVQYMIDNDKVLRQKRKPYDMIRFVAQTVN